MGINPAIWSVGFAQVAEGIDDFAVFTADLERYSGLERTFSKYPEHCYNVGIAEQNMVGIAAGMAMQGTQTYMTTYAPFMSMRCADQIRHLMGNLNLNMKAIGSAAGLSAGLSGSSLLAINDIALMRSIPNMVVLSPADCTEAVKMVEAMAETDAPTYMRFCGATNIPCVYTEDYRFEIGKAVTLRKGERIAIIATGTDIVFNSLKAAETIKEQYGMDITVINMHTIKPVDKECIIELTNRHEYIFTVEEHNVIGGLGSAVSEIISTLDTSCRQIFIGIEDKNYKMGSRQFMLEQTGLTSENIVNIVGKFIEEN
jgi:transketolase